MKWIPCSERLPEDLISVIYFGKLNGDNKAGTGEAFYDGEDWVSVREYESFDYVTHWQPLPDPPKDEQ